MTFKRSNRLGLRHFTLLAGSILWPLTACSAVSNEQADIEVQPKPNIVLIVTDDQGYGDLGYHNNPIIQTPNIDDIAAQSARLTNFHVDPTCSPTRSALLTGKHSLRAGVWHTILGRYMLGPEHVTLAESLQENGYTTGIFGKWHLGDNYPYRPQDQGFDEVLIHGGGGVGQTPDFWGNTQFDDTYFRNGEPEKFNGYATKIWFDEAKKFIDKQQEKPYFAYIALNAPHGPYRAPETHIKPYEKLGLGRDMASFYGMISYIDEQVGDLRAYLRTDGQLDNTIFIFMTDNGSSYHTTNDKTLLTKGHRALAEQFPDWQPNANLRGYKGQVYEGGHRVPFFISYPNGDIPAGDYTDLTAHFDIMPTLLELADIPQPNDIFDGISLATYLSGQQAIGLPERPVVITNQRVYHPSVKRPIAVAYNHWRYISSEDGEQLFDLKQDPKQQNDLKQAYPEILKKMREHKLAWWQDMQASGFKDRYISVGNDAENPVRLNAMDWMEVPDNQAVPWFIGHQGPAPEWDYVHWLTEEDKYQALPWYIDVEQTAKYRLKAYFHDAPAATPINKKRCVIQVDNKQFSAPVYGRASHCAITLPLASGKQKITAWFTDNELSLAKEKAAFYLYLERI